MENDVRQERTVYPGNVVAVEKLDGMLSHAFYRINRDEKKLLKLIYPNSPQKIHWEAIRHLRVIGDNSEIPLEYFEKLGIHRGFYLNTDGSWLLVILPENSNLHEYLLHCGQQLESLWILNAKMHSLSFCRMINLKTLYLIDNSLLVAIEQLACLTKLEKMILQNSPVLTELPGLEKLACLTSLSIRKCGLLSILPVLDALTELTSLSLSRCNNLSTLVGLEKLTKLTTLDLSGCQKLATVPGLEHLEQLKELNLFWCSSLVVLPELKNLTQLTTLNLLGCKSIHKIPDSIRYCKKLRLLNLSQLHLNDLPDILPEITEKFTMMPDPFYDAKGKKGP